MTVREVPAAQTGRGNALTVIMALTVSTFFNSRKAGSRSSPPFLWPTFSAVLPLLQLLHEYVELRRVRGIFPPDKF